MKILYRRRIIFSFCAAVIVLVAMGAGVYSSFLQMNWQKARVEHTYKVIDTLQDILSNLKDVQSSQRGFVITGMEDYLTPYYIAEPKVREDVKALEQLVGDNKVQVPRAESLAEHVESRLATADAVIASYRTQGSAVAFDMIRQGSGKREMDAIRTIVAEMIATEKELLHVRRDAVENYSKITMYAAAAGLLICIGILALVFYLISKEAAYRARTEESLRRAFADMERNNKETQMISRMGDYLRNCRTEDEAYGMIGGCMPSLFPGTYGSVTLFNNSRNLVQTVLTWGKLPAGITMEFEPETCWALRQGRPHYEPGDKTVPVCGHLEHKVEDGVTLCIPMQALGETIGQVLIGADSVDNLGPHESDVMRVVTEQISLAIANLKLQRVLKEQSIKDPLTKLFNRRYLEETLARECARAARNKLPMCVLIMDIDHFKKVNDTYGHDAGDAVLVSFAQLLTKKSRKEDIACRLGGEEFVLVFPSAGLELARTRAEEICAATREMKVKFQNAIIPITVSIGISLFPDHGEGTEELLQKADICLYKAKQSGRDRVIVYDESFTGANG